MFNKFYQNLYLPSSPKKPLSERGNKTELNDQHIHQCLKPPPPCGIMMVHIATPKHRYQKVRHRKRGMNEKIQSVLQSLPHKPGIYLMKDASGTIIYVGKAISLYNRVRSYFQESTDLSPKNRSMVAKVDDIEFLVVKNEVEALVLESNYIKQYRPRYNVLMRDDKSYPYIKVSLTEDFPRVYRVRSFQRDGNRYFGPYTNSGAVDATLDLLNKLFAFRTCRYDDANWAPPRQPQGSSLREGEPP